MISVRITASVLSMPFRQVSRHYLEILFTLFHDRLETRGVYCFWMHILFWSEVVAVLTFDFDSCFILEWHLLDLTLRFDKQTWIRRGFQSLLRWLTLVASCQRRALITRGVYFIADLVPRMTWLVCAAEEKERGKRCSGCNSELADCAVCVWMLGVTTASSLGIVGNLGATLAAFVQEDAWIHIIAYRCAEYRPCHLLWRNGSQFRSGQVSLEARSLLMRMGNGYMSKHMKALGLPKVSLVRWVSFLRLC